ncbi:MAG: 30S ribosomal protein S8 [Candidatus Levybacteria bacterium]|nr:30S ribosomal protein S8 [Candidatus Levybacteria bacterium]MDZ4227926.1 30S ribosomal protein S8 [Candidatus Levybacteria bacterium]
MNYRVSDLIIRIKNAARAKRRAVVLENLKINKAICKVLVSEGFLEHVDSEERDGKKVLVAKVRYEKRNPVLTDVLVVSKPSLRIYATAAGIPNIQRRGRHTIIMSTNKGIMTGREAAKKNMGGEVLFRIW